MCEKEREESISAASKLVIDELRKKGKKEIPKHANPVFSPPPKIQRPIFSNIFYGTATQFSKQPTYYVHVFFLKKSTFTSPPHIFPLIKGQTVPRKLLLYLLRTPTFSLPPPSLLIPCKLDLSSLYTLLHMYAYTYTVPPGGLGLPYDAKVS